MERSVKMEKQEVSSAMETASPPQMVWGTLTATQQEMVLQTMVWICGQIAEQWSLEVCHEPGDE
jgi:hypothetical protein